MNQLVEQIHPSVEIIFSETSDGSMAAGGGAESSQEHQKNVDRFLSKNNFTGDPSKVFVTYSDMNSYTEVVRLSKDDYGKEVKCDALWTTEPGRVIILPVADCVATVVFDPVAGILGVLHLGRYASVAGLIEKFVIEVADEAGSDPNDWLVWMSPSIRSGHDRLDYFDPPRLEEWSDFMNTGEDGKIHIDTVGHNRSRFERAGVASANITVSPFSTYDDTRFYSQRAYSETNDPSRLGRMLVAARIRP